MADRLVTLTYFHFPRGKYYGSGVYRSSKQFVFEVFEEVSAMLEQRKLPGLVKNHSPYYVLVDCTEFENNYPGLIVPLPESISS